MRIYLRNVKKYTLIDDIDYERCSKIKWYLGSRGYVVANVRGNGWHGRKQITMHRFILNAPTGKVVDHINRNKLDNRGKNLRFCDTSANNHNRGSLGVYWNKQKKHWRAQISFHGKKIMIGSFNSKRLAVAKYREYSRMLYPLPYI